MCALEVLGDDSSILEVTYGGSTFCVSAVTLLSAPHTSAQYCPQQTVRKTSPKTDSEGRLDGQQGRTQMPSPILQRAPSLVLSVGCGFLWKREVGRGAGALTSRNPPLSSLRCICSPNRHHAPILSMQLHQNVPLVTCNSVTKVETRLR